MVERCARVEKDVGGESRIKDSKSVLDGDWTDKSLNTVEGKHWGKVGRGDGWGKGEDTV